MNTTTLYKGLLESFSAELIRNYFDIDYNTKEVVISKILKQFTEQNIIDFTFENFGVLKQHIYILKPNSPVSSSWKPVPTNYIGSNSGMAGGKIHNILFESLFDVYNVTKGIRESIAYFLPTRIREFNGLLIVSLNIQERSITSYSSDKLISITKRIDENYYIDEIRNSLPKGTTFVPVNLNKGVKDLWSNDLIDAAYAKFKKSKSTSTEAMDMNSTVKNTYPKEYGQMMASPLNKTVFKVLDEKSDISRFAIEPDKGKMSITRFSKNENSVSDLVDLILSKN